MALDIMCAILAVYGFYMGFTRGIIKTVFTVMAVFFGIIAAAKFGPSMTDFLQSIFSYHNPLMFLAGLLLTFVLTMAIIRMLANGLENVLESANINIINQITGGVLMALILVAFFSVLVLFGNKSHIIDDTTKEESITYPMLEKMPDRLLAAGKVLKPVFTDFWQYSVDFMDRLENMNMERSEQDNVFDIEDEDDEKTTDNR